MRRRARPAPALAAVVLAVAPLHAGGLPAADAERAAVRVDHAALGRILADVVRDEAVDYERLRREHRGALERYLARMAAVKSDRLDRDEQLAFYINVYNATVLREVTGRYEPGYTVARGSFALFDERLVRLHDRTVSLNDLEHRIIRPGFREPRIHVALVCAARSCPPLLSRAYDAEDLEALLERGMRRFITGGTRNRIDLETRTLRLSRLFDWYAEDFGGESGRVAYVDRYTPEDVSGFAVEFIEYDWALNVVSSPR